MKANKPMTDEQLDELMTVAVNMQRDAETDCNRPSAMFAYAVQVAVMELRKVRNDAAALAAENAGLKEIRKNLAEFIHEELDAGYPLNMDIETPATDAFLAEVRASGVDALVERRLTAARLAKEAGHEITARDLEGEAIRARFFAMELRKGVQS